VIKTLYPAIFNTISLTGPSSSDSLPFTSGALNKVYSKVAGTKAADTINKKFCEALRPGPGTLTSGSLPGSFRHEAHAIQRARSNKIMHNDGLWKEGCSVG